jgi:hypothetical protein
MFLMNYTLGQADFSLYYIFNKSQMEYYAAPAAPAPVAPAV